MAKVFISHAGADSAIAAELHQWLVDEGHEVFLDRDLREGIGIGEEWEARLHERLRWADALVCLVTSAYVASVWCTAELSIARSRGSRLLPVRAEAGVNHPLLKALQHTDLTANPAVARRVLAEGLRRVDAAGGAGWPDGTSPYPGLRAFESDLQRVFFGRAADVDELVERLRSPAERAIGALLLVVGPSGCGKSSLVRAGLLPAVAEETGWWTLRAFVPGADPLTNLARELAVTAKDLGLKWNVGEVRNRLETAGLVPITDELLLAAPGRRRRLLVVIDQFEELLTRTSPEECAKFAAVVRGALTGPVQVVATLRPEFLDQVQTDPELATLPTRMHLVQPLRRQALREVIEGPARIAGIEVSDSLVNDLVADTDSGDALPLLAFTLSQLARGVGRGGELSSARYQEIGGVQGALVRQAEVALTEAMAATGRDRHQVLESLLALVTVDVNGRPTRWPADRGELATEVATELDAFVAHRLLVTDTADEKVLISVAHEAFLSAWPPLRDAIADRASALRSRRAIEQAATEWDAEGRPPERLWERGQLAAALADTGAQLGPAREPSDAAPASAWLRRLNKELVVDRVRLSERARRFLTLAIRRDRQRRRRAVSILSALLGVAMIAAIFAAVQSRTAQEQKSVAEDQRRVAIARQLTAQADEIRASDPQTSLRLGIAADRIHPDQQNRAGLVNSLMATRYAGNLDAGLYSSVPPDFTRDGKLMATTTAENKLMLWDVSGQGAPRPIGKPIDAQGPDAERAYLGRPQFSADGRTLAGVQVLSVATETPQVVRWDISDPSAPKAYGSPFTVTGKTIANLFFSPDRGQLAVVTSSPVTITMWDVSGATARRLSAPIRAGEFWQLAALLPGGRTVLTVASDKAGKYSAVRWDVTDPSRPHAVGTPIPVDGMPAYNEATNTLATRVSGSFGDTVSLWDLTDPAGPRKLPASLYPPNRGISWMQFSPDGRMIAIRGDGSKSTSAVTLWDLSDRTRPAAYNSETENQLVSDQQLSRLVFLPGRPRIVTISDAGREVALWDIGNPKKPQRVGAPFTISGADSGEIVVFPDGRRLAGFLQNGSMDLWDLTDAGEPRLLSEPSTTGNAVVSLAYFPDATTLTATRNSGELNQWNIADRSAPRVLSPALRLGPLAEFGQVVFSSKGGLIAYDSPDGIVVADSTDSSRRSVLKKPFLPGDQGGPHADVIGFSPQGTVLAISVLIPRVGSRVSLWDVRDPAQVRLLGSPLKERGIGAPRDLIWFPDGRTLVQGEPGGAYLTDISDPSHPRELGDPVAGHRESGRSLAVSPDGRLMATGSDDQTAILWDVSDPANPRQLGVPLTGHDHPVIAVAFSPDGSILATGDDRGGVRLWDLAAPNSPRLLGTPLQGHYLNPMIFSPDGRTLVTGSNIGGGIQLRDLTGLYELREQAAERACERSNGGLSRYEWDLYVVGLPYQDTCAP